MQIGKYLVLAIAVVLMACPAVNGADQTPDYAAVYGAGPEKFSLATGSPGELGLLEALAWAFNREMGDKTALQWVKAGSGASLAMLKDKKVDMVMVHAPEAEKKPCRKVGPSSAP
jgi:tungstate transport system substrate-binding protein